MILAAACKPGIKEEDKLFHAGPAASGFGVIYFGLYKESKYQFCDGDFMDAGCAPVNIACRAIPSHCTV